MKTPSASDPTAVLSIILSNKTLFFHTLSNPESPIELAFQSKYGNIVSYSWFGDGLVMIGFSVGYFVVVSTNMNEIGQELFQTRNHKDALTDVAVCHNLGKAATCGDGSVKVHELGDLKDVYAILDLEDERGQLVGVAWSEDGGFLSVGTKSGNIYTFLARLPILGSSYLTYSAHLTGICEVTVSDHDKILGKGFNLKRELAFEPSVVGIGQYHWAVGFQDHVMYHYGGWPKRPLKWGKPRPNEVNGRIGEIVLEKKDYLGTVKSVTISDMMAAALLTDGRLQVHPIEGRNDKQSQKIFPDRDIASKIGGSSDPDGPAQIVSAVLTNELLVYAMAGGIVHHYAVDDWALVNEYRHKTGAVAVYPQIGSSRFVLQDDANDFFVVDPVKDVAVPVPSISAKTVSVLWETPRTEHPRNVFISYDDAFITTHAFHQHTIKGPQCLSLGTTKLPYGLKPLVFDDGAVLCQSPSGKLMSIPLSTHEPLAERNLLSQTEQAQGKALQLAYTLGLMADVWSTIGTINSRKAWTMLAEASLYVLDIQTSRRVYRQILHDAGMVMTLNSYQEYEEILILGGYICIIFREFEHAQELFLQSTEPIHALYLRRDLMQWDKALHLAAKLAPNEVTVIAREYATQLESGEKYPEALEMFEKALETSNDHPSELESVRDEHQILCSSGITRMTFRMGDVTRGMRMLAGVDDPKLLGDCAAILEGLKLFTECGLLYERAGAFEKAADAYIKGKQWTKVSPLLDKVTSPKIFMQYAKAKEAEKQYKEAATAYEKAKSFDDVVRLYVEQLHEIEKAVEIVRETRSRESARIVSKFFQARLDFKSVVEFCLMAGMVDEAFELAQQHEVMEHFAELVKPEASTQLLTNISGYFENRRQLLQAGKYILLAGDYTKALRLFVRCPVLDGESIDLAIEAVGLAKNDKLTHELIDYLMGESDGVPKVKLSNLHVLLKKQKEAKYIFKLYMSLGSFRDAARTAIIIAREEQTLGNYRAAHDLLLDNHKQLKRNKAPIPSELDRMLMILHSYILVKVAKSTSNRDDTNPVVKTLIKVDEHEKGARMLIRVSNNISKFPAHVVPILTSTVIECYRAGMKKEAFEYAAMLMRPEYRALLDAKYKRKIEQIVRRPEKEESVEEKTSPCPFCGYKIPETTLDCIECKNHIPYCIASGRHMILDDWTQCPSCEFPALKSEMDMLVSKTHQCPMCCCKLSMDSIVLCKNSRELLRGSKQAEEGSSAVQAKPPSRENDDGDFSADPFDKTLSAIESTVPVVAAAAGSLGGGQETDHMVPAAASNLKTPSLVPGSIFEPSNETKVNRIAWGEEESQEDAFIDDIFPKVLQPSSESKMQDGRCHRKALSSFPKCSPCIQKVAGTMCRFKDFRLFQSDSNKLTYGPFFNQIPEPQERIFHLRTVFTNQQLEELNVVFPASSSTKAREIQYVATSESNEDYILSKTAPTIKIILDSCNKAIKSKENVFFKGLEPGNREYCDKCFTSLFSLSWVCCICGTDLCLKCYDEWIDRTLIATYCALGSHHQKLQMMLVIRRKLSEFDTITKRIEQITEGKEEPESPLLVETMKESLTAPTPFIVIDPETSDPLSTFELAWQTGTAVVCKRMMDLKADWSPNYFQTHFGMEETEIEDCAAASRLLRPVGEFFQGFHSTQQRPKDENGENFILKLPDWPTDSDFQSKFPEHFKDFMENVPFKQYTTRNGPRNLAARMPIELVPSDLGPKLYCAYGSFDEGPKGVGTTPLHLDMADAVNFMVYSSDASESTGTNGSENTDTQQPSRPGAVWDIYPRSALSELRAFAGTILKERGLPHDDPIHDQKFYLSNGLRESPESVGHCLQLTNEFRTLSMAHKRKQDLLQLHAILWSTWLTSPIFPIPDGLLENLPAAEPELEIEKVPAEVVEQPSEFHSIPTPEAEKSEHIPRTMQRRSTRNLPKEECKRQGREIKLYNIASCLPLAKTRPAEKVKPELEPERGGCKGDYDSNDDGMEIVIELDDEEEDDRRSRASDESSLIVEL
ncbi:WD repeat-containing protein 19 [Phlyctochytrium planicorne]|nr:WD repeat-containing protein 19 [Phlyctochytrium planicorne]